MATQAAVAFNFIGQAAFSNTAGEVRQFSTGGNTYIFGDVDGNGAQDFLPPPPISMSRPSPPISVSVLRGRTVSRYPCLRPALAGGQRVIRRTNRDRARARARAQAGAPSILSRVVTPDAATPTRTVRCLPNRPQARYIDKIAGPQ